VKSWSGLFHACFFNINMTKTEVLTRFSQHYADCDSTLAGQLFDESHRQILNELEARNGTIVVPLTSGTREYALASSCSKIWEAYYQESALESTWYKLAPMSLQQLAGRGAWRTQAQLVRPTEFYVSTSVSGNSSTNVIGFNPVPPATSSGSYPNVTLYCTVVVDLLPGDSLPVWITFPSVYVYLMCYRYAIMRRPESAKLYLDLYRDELEKCSADAKSIQFENEGTFLRVSMRGLGVAR
jgi:hypothetical protein